MRVADMLTMIYEIGGKEINFTYLDEQQWSSYYSHTSCRYTPKTSQKIMIDQFVDLEQGLLNIVKVINNDQP